MKGDSGATSHYVRDQDKACLTNPTPYSGPSVLLPDADSIPPSQQGTLTLHHDLSRQAQIGTVLPQLQSSSLLSLGQLCDDGCDVILNKRKSSMVTLGNGITLDIKVSVSQFRSLRVFGK